jgi:hypothetical protein
MTPSDYGLQSTTPQSNYKNRNEKVSNTVLTVIVPEDLLL